MCHRMGREKVLEATVQTMRVMGVKWGVKWGVGGVRVRGE